MAKYLYFRRNFAKELNKSFSDLLSTNTKKIFGSKGLMQPDLFPLEIFLVLKLSNSVFMTGHFEQINIDAPLLTT